MKWGIPDKVSVLGVYAQVVCVVDSENLSVKLAEQQWL